MDLKERTKHLGSKLLKRVFYAAKLVFLSVSITSSFIAFLIAPIIFVPNAGIDVAVGWLVIVVPLFVYALSVAQHVSEDFRDIPKLDKIRGALLPGLNKMLFGILVVTIGLIILIHFDIGWDTE